jgi:hypothetical protein
VNVLRRAWRVYADPPASAAKPRAADPLRWARLAVIVSCCFHLLGDAVAAMRDGLPFVWLADLLTLALVVMLARELKRERGHL